MPLGSGWGATGEGESQQQAAAGGEGAQSAGSHVARCSGTGSVPASGDPLRQADDRLAAGVAPEQQRDQQEQQRHGGKQEGCELGHSGPG